MWADEGIRGEVCAEGGPLLLADDEESSPRRYLTSSTRATSRIFCSCTLMSLVASCARRGAEAAEAAERSVEVGEPHEKPASSTSGTLVLRARRASVAEPQLPKSSSSDDSELFLWRGGRGGASSRSGTLVLCAERWWWARAWAWMMSTFS